MGRDRASAGGYRVLRQAAASAWLRWINRSPTTTGGTAPTTAKAANSSGWNSIDADAASAATAGTSSHRPSTSEGTASQDRVQAVAFAYESGLVRPGR